MRASTRREFAELGLVAVRPNFRAVVLVWARAQELPVVVLPGDWR